MLFERFEFNEIIDNKIKTSRSVWEASTDRITINVIFSISLRKVHIRFLSLLNTENIIHNNINNFIFRCERRKRRAHFSAAVNNRQKHIFEGKKKTEREKHVNKN